MIIQNTRKNRSLKAPKSNENFIHINNKLFDNKSIVFNQQNRQVGLIL